MAILPSHASPQHLVQRSFTSVLGPPQTAAHSLQGEAPLEAGPVLLSGLQEGGVVHREFPGNGADVARVPESHHLHSRAQHSKFFDSAHNVVSGKKVVKLAFLISVQ